MSTNNDPLPKSPDASGILSFFAQAGTGFWLAGRDGRYRMVNPAYARILGHESPEALTRDIVSIPAQVYVNEADWRACLAVLDGGPSMTREVEVYGRDAQAIWMREVISAVDPGDGSPRLIGGVVRDVSHDRLERGDREAMLGMLRHVMDAITDAMVLSDLDGRAVFCNRVFAARFGLNDEAVEGRDLGEWLTCLDPADAGHLAQLEKKPAPYNLILREQPGGALRFTTVSPFLDPSGGLLGAILMLRDDRLMAVGGEG